LQNFEPEGSCATQKGSVSVAVSVHIYITSL